MKKSYISKVCIICVICMIAFMAFGIPSQATDDNIPTPVKTDIPIYMNGIKISNGLLINETSYIPLRAFVNSLGYPTNIAWDSETKTVTVTGEDLELTTVLGSKNITVNGRCFYAPDTISQVDNSIIIPVRLMSDIFNVTVEWDEESTSVNLDTTYLQMPEGASTYYDTEDLKWLSHLIYSEAGNQPLEGKIGVGNVVLNRVEDSTCPDTVYDVIFDNRFGVQFSVTESSIIYEEPNDESLAAAKMCLEGFNIVDDSIYFVNPDIGASSWFTNTRVFVSSIGEHDFYA